MGRAWLFHGSGRPMELLSVVDPVPADGEILVRITCCTLCRSDLHTHAGRRNEPTPTILGHEITGRIAAFGASAPRTDVGGYPLEIGQRITWSVVVACGQCFFCTHDLPQKCVSLTKYGHLRTTPGRPTGGGLADAILLQPGTAIFRIPDEVPDPIAATANCATATVAGILRSAGGVAGRSVLVLGAGMLGLTACAMARESGALQIIAADPLAESRDRAIRFGATAAVDPKDPEYPQRLTGLTQGRGADLVLELAGTADSVCVAMQSARIGGTILLAGTVAPVGAIPFDPETIVRRMLTIIGVHNYHPQDLGTAVQFLAGPGRAYPFGSLIGTTFPLSQAEQALNLAHEQPGLRIAVVPENA